jgi:hypothetical protein
LSLFSDDSLGKVAADGFYILIVDSEDVMTVQMHADIRVSKPVLYNVHTLNVKYVTGLL